MVVVIAAGAAFVLLRRGADEPPPPEDPAPSKGSPPSSASGLEGSAPRSGAGTNSEAVGPASPRRGRPAWAGDESPALPEPTGTLAYAGSVVDEAGRGLPGAEVWVSLRREFAGGVSTTSMSRKAEADGSGRFHFSDMPAGRYDVGARAANRETFEGDLVLTSDRRDAVLPLRFGEDLALRVVPPEGWPRSRSTLWLESADGSPTVLEVDAEGRFVASRLPDGAYRVHLWNEPEDESRDATILVQRTIPLVVRGPREEVLLRFEPDEDIGLLVEIPDGMEEVDVSVLVVDGPGAVGEPSLFHASRTEDGRSLTRSQATMLWPPIRAETADGHAFLRGLPKGRHRLRITAPGYETVERAVDVAGPQTLRVVLARTPGRLVRTDVASTYWRVETRETTGTARWRTILWQDARSQLSHTPVLGVGAAHISPGTYEFRLLTSRFAPTSTAPVVVEDDPKPLWLSWPEPRGATLRGTVRSRPAGPPTEALLRLFRVETDGSLDALVEKETSTERGVYAIEGLAPGRYRLSLSPTGAPTLAEVEMGTDDTVLDVALEPAAGR